MEIKVFLCLVQFNFSILPIWKLKRPCKRYKILGPLISTAETPLSSIKPAACCHRIKYNKATYHTYKINLWLFLGKILLLVVLSLILQVK